MRLIVQRQAPWLLALMVGVFSQSRARLKGTRPMSPNLLGWSFRPSAFPRLLDRVPELLLSERSSNARMVGELDELANRKLFHGFDLSTLDSKGSFEYVRVIQLFALQDMRAIGRQNYHEGRRVEGIYLCWYLRACCRIWCSMP